MTINQMARDPTLNVDKMTALQAMHRELVADQRRVEFFDALAQLATALPAIKKDGRLAIEKNGKLIQNTPYATWENLHRSVMRILSDARFALMHQTENAGDGLLRVRSTLSRNGHSESTFYDLPIDASGSKNNVQGRGSSTSYGKRYNTINLLNIRTEGEDTDGRFVPDPEPTEAIPLIDPKVADAMVDLINGEYPDQEEAARIQRIKFAGRMCVPTIHHIAEKDVNNAWKILNAWKSTREEKKRARQ